MAIIPTQSKYPDRAGYLGLDTDRNVLVGMSDGILQDMTNSTPEGCVNVKDFGAKGDGVTDDIQSIQAAIDYAIIDRKPVYFPYGTYIISSPINVTLPSNINYRWFKIFTDGAKIKSDREFNGIQLMAIRKPGGIDSDLLWIDGFVFEGSRAQNGLDFLPDEPFNSIVHPTSNPYFQTILVSNCVFQKNRVGLRFSGMTLRVVTSTFRNNIMGALIIDRAYNNSFFGCSFINNDGAVHIKTTDLNRTCMRNDFYSCIFNENRAIGVIISNSWNTAFHGCYFKYNGVRVIDFNNEYPTTIPPQYDIYTTNELEGLNKYLTFIATYKFGNYPFLYGNNTQSLYVTSGSQVNRIQLANSFNHSFVPFTSMVEPLTSAYTTDILYTLDGKFKHDGAENWIPA